MIKTYLMAVATVAGFFLLLGFIGPALISAKSTELVLLGILAVIIGAPALAYGAVKSVRRIQTHLEEITSEETS